MAGNENEDIKSWEKALAENKLTPEQLAVLERMVADRESDSLERAAAMLDWQETVINPEEHMYGF